MNKPNEMKDEATLPATSTVAAAATAAAKRRKTENERNHRINTFVFVREDFFNGAAAFFRSM